MSKEEAAEYLRGIGYDAAQPDRASSKQVTGKLDLISRQAAIDAMAEASKQVTGKLDLISRQAAIDAMAEALIELPIGLTEAYELAEDALSGLPSAEPEILKDGTLVIDLTLEQLDKVNRVLLTSGRWCKLMYIEMCNADMRGEHHDD